MLDWLSPALHWISHGSLGGDTYFISRSLLLRGLGVIYLIAFISLWVQIKGLIGSNGILPAQEFLQAAKQHFGSGRFWELPTIFWINASDAALQLACAAGVLCSLGLIVGFAPMAMTCVLWILYLSLVNVGQDFLSFQWDVLLIEVGLLAVLFSPVGWSLRTATGDISPLIILLFWYLLARFMFESGVVKLTSGDTSWWDLTALTYHYESQPLPTWTAWSMHHAPLWFHKASAVFMYSVELVLPIFIFLTTPLRILAAIGIALLNLIIGFTGNYTFFNLLTIVLCLPLIGDSVWLKVLPTSFTNLLHTSIAATNTVSPIILSLSKSYSLVVVLFAVLTLLITIPQLTRSFGPRLRTLEHLEFSLQQFHSINSYGLFRVMTKGRPEIVIEGSNDGTNWQAYEFTDKPGDRQRRPRFVEPHQPRLDWQMWFAALSNFQQTSWFQNLMVRLLQGSPDVLSLLKHNPFPEAPPRYLRAAAFDYRFTTPAERKETGNWWHRELRGAYSPVLVNNSYDSNEAAHSPNNAP